MKLITMTFIAFNFIIFVNPVKAQSVESIWISTSTNSFKTGETVIVLVSGASATPIQGFTFQLGYDPVCLKPISVTCPVPNMNGLSFPQTSGLVDQSFNSTTSQIADGVLADVRFITLGACQTNIELRSAAFIVKNESGFSAPLPGLEINKEKIVITISKDKGTSQDVIQLGTPVTIDAKLDTSNSSFLLTGIVILLALIVVILLIGVLLLVFILRGKNTRA